MTTISNDAFRIHQIPGLDALWQETRGTPEVCIAIIDGAVSRNHALLKNADLEFRGSDTGDDAMADHGTQIASIVFSTDPSVLPGIAPGCKGVCISVFRQQEKGQMACSQLDLARAIELALDHGVHIINISAGQFSNEGVPEFYLQKALQRCREAGVLVVAAAGNDGCECVHVPAADTSVLAVGAMDKNGHPLGFSNWGRPYRDNGLLFPGEAILCSNPDETLTTMNGTSYATAIASGIAALMLSYLVRHGRNADGRLVREILLSSAKPCVADNPAGCDRFLCGALDLNAALSLLSEHGNPTVHASNAPHVLWEPGQAAVFQYEYKPDLKNPPLQHKSIHHFPLLNDHAMSPSSNEMLYPETGSNNPAVPAINTDAHLLLPGDSHSLQGVQPSCSCQQKSRPAAPAFVYAIGTISYDFLTEASKDAFRQSMGSDPNDPGQLLKYLEANPEAAEDFVWVLSLDSTPIYAIVPTGGFAATTYARLRSFLRAQLVEGAERVSIPGVLAGTVRLLAGQEVPVLIPRPQGMYCWSTPALLQTLLGLEPLDSEDREAFFTRKSGVHNFLDRIYYELRNLGVSARERAINHAATNAFQIEKVYEKAISEQLELDTIEVERSPVCRPDSDCWDVKLIFFHPLKRVERARKVFRFTVDVSHVIPVTVGEVRAWNIF